MRAMVSELRADDAPDPVLPVDAPAAPVRAEDARLPPSPRLAGRAVHASVQPVHRGPFE
jgi:hypothetical protein